MKTLLLTLVVVTIVCLDFGHTLICYNDHGFIGKTTETCKNGETTCYEERWTAARGRSQSSSLLKFFWILSLSSGVLAIPASLMSCDEFPMYSLIQNIDEDVDVYRA